ncbi:MAG: site-2 protease family protein [Luteolibacter sp.]|uniref:metalloprotease n=1 Tax=Luteolibacter sp. TaxID=1962973 RepID=UPI003267585C
MIRFSLFGIPVEVQPFFWIVMALLGRADRADSREDFLAVALFVIAAFISVLIHELGHALTGRKLGGGYASIILTSFGGLAMNQGGRFTRHQRFLMIAAGPGAGFAFLLAILVTLSLIFDSTDVIAFASRHLFGQGIPFKTFELMDFLEKKPFIHFFLADLLLINFWWGVLNLLPIMPLDGGQITDIYVKPQRRVFLIGLVAATAMSLFGFLKLGLYPGFFFGYFAWINYQNMKSLNWQ